MGDAAVAAPSLRFGLHAFDNHRHFVIDRLRENLFASHMITGLPRAGTPMLSELQAYGVGAG